MTQRFADGQETETDVTGSRQALFLGGNYADKLQHAQGNTKRIIEQRTANKKQRLDTAAEKKVLMFSLYSKLQF